MEHRSDAYIWRASRGLERVMDHFGTPLGEGPARGPIEVAIGALEDESASFEDFFARERDRLFGLLVLVTGDRHEAEDLAQDAFVVAWERWDRVGTGCGRASSRPGCTRVGAGGLLGQDLATKAAVARAGVIGVPAAPCCACWPSPTSAGGAGIPTPRRDRPASRRSRDPWLPAERPTGLGRTHGGSPCSVWTPRRQGPGGGSAQDARRAQRERRGDGLMFDAIKERREFNFKRLRDMAQREGLEVRWVNWVKLNGSTGRRRIAFVIREGPRSVVIGEAPTVSRAWEWFRGWLEGRRWGPADGGV
jgi:hypothetical protein